MTETVAVTAARPARTGAVERSNHALARPPEVVWGACIAVQVVIAALLTRYTYFFADDFLFLRQAQTQGFGRGYLAEPLFQHFSPVTRVLNKVLMRIDPGSFAFAHGIQLALYACAIAAFAFVVRGILGRTWLAFALTVLFGQSVFLLRLLNWWTATANLLPATIFMLVALGAYLRWHDGGARRWLAISLIAFVGSLLDYETAMVFPAYLVMIRLLILNDSLNPRTWVNILWRERWSWAAYVALDAAALVNYYTRYYAAMPRPSLGQLAHFTEISLVQSFTPALFGVARPYHLDSAMFLPPALCLLVLLAVLLWLRPAAWRCVLVALIAFLLTLEPLGLNRIHLFGIYIGTEPYYQQSAQFMFLTLTAFALGPRFAARRPSLRWLRMPRVPVAAILAGVLAVAAGYGALYVTSVKSLANAAWQPRTSKAFFHRFLSDVARVRAATGRDPNLIDSTVPDFVMPAPFGPFNRYSLFFPVVDSHLRYDESGESFVVGPSGALQRVTFAARATSAPHRSFCARPGAGTPVRIHLSKAVRLGPSTNGHAGGIELSYRLARTTPVTLLAAGPGASGPPTAIDFVPHVWGPGAGTGIVLATVPATVSTLDVGLDGGGCITRAAAGTFVPARG